MPTSSMRPCVYTLLSTVLLATLGACASEGGSKSEHTPGDTGMANDVQTSTPLRDGGTERDTGKNAGDVADETRDVRTETETGTGDTGGSNGGGVVETTEGPVRGVDLQEGVWSFKGIPYAKPPTGSRRWRAPRPPADRDAIFEADSFGSACPQDYQAFGPNGIPSKSEDCLTLNVWTPAPDDQTRAVMVWIHGGGHVQGSSGTAFNTDGEPLYDGTDLAKRGVVVVSINYRLGPLGFLAHPALVDDSGSYAKAGNYGLLDQIRALKWVRDNAAAFGGDPENVTVFGESAGAVDICALMASPKAEGLFDRAIMESGNCLNERTSTYLDRSTRQNESAFDQGRRYADTLGCKNASDVAACMRSKSAEAIVEARPLTVGIGGAPSGETFAPVVDGDVLPKPPAEALSDGSAMDVPVIAGVNANEATAFMTPSIRSMSPKQYRQRVRQQFASFGHAVLKTYPVGDYPAPWRAWSAIVSDLTFVCPTRRALADHVGRGHRGYFYVFSHVRPAWRTAGLGAFHGAEITFVFHDSRPNWSSSDERIARAIQRGWTQFAEQGRSGTVAGTSWPVYDPSVDEAMELKGRSSGRRSGFRQKECQFWQQYVDF